ncbi:DUF4386 domain-containing protein [Pelagovum pacificum]|uniref:DUF4386 domain-containing protein n=1 Tax=Pelagovum pacificum TaxID=2588711 RepID=A0A5C5GH70_9RHOB|nr:DUF4386 domain-containing protein [Pelagovum pacificum]QQA42737.1 DUF4386 domain-containing protein [Pelagovum pacificum]TNY34112.1 DUF4386 domain-containing protein [Pelagovum pacificum]
MNANPQTARLAGLLYLTIIICGISAEAALRGPLIDLGDASATASAIRESIGTFRLAFAADVIMAISDAALAVLLFVMFRPVAPTLALAAMIFRLVQAVLIAANLLNMQAAWLLFSAGQDMAGLAPEQANAVAMMFLNLHAHGYDLGLVFFGINSLMTGALIRQSGMFPRLLGTGLAAAGLVYLTGSALRFLAPGLWEMVLPAYGLTVLAEGAFCIALLMKKDGTRQQAVA